MTTVFEPLIARALEGVTMKADCTFGPIPLDLGADVAADLREIGAHLAPCSEPSWQPLSVVTTTTDTIQPGDMPDDLRPTEGRTAISHDGDVTVYTAGHENCTWILDGSRSLAIRWVERLDDLPLWEQINPLRAAGRWWSVQHHASMVHCGAVGDDRGAVLLVGDAGAGKSTTSLACLGSSLDVIGDDFCFVESDPTGNESYVHPTYRLAKLDERGLAMLPWLRERVVGTGMRGKSLIDIGAEPLATRRVRAICHVVQSPGAGTRFERIGRADAIKAAAPSTVIQARLVERETLAGVMATARRAPAFRMFVDDVRDAPGAIDQLLDRDLQA
jgi:hypothetical protein